ncbi:hypothetical protein BHE90_014499 [Fusarium euwallaceae]|uniref:Uncharacterized protein n=1 Tax=Fusarium euwallaceae TaxID=1147111 RepID=A0A430L5W4_9HYPO|nr:hypothetical protein BHE90_014499 [Fusarium euwallaceae]
MYSAPQSPNTAPESPGTPLDSPPASPVSTCSQRSADTDVEYDDEHEDEHEDEHDDEHDDQHNDEHGDGHDDENNGGFARAPSNHIPHRDRHTTLTATFVYGLALSVFGWAVICSLVHPPAIPLPIHRPIIDLTKTLPSLDFSQNDSYNIYSFKLQFESNCTCPLKWIRNRRRYLPENPDDLWESDLWADIPPNLPGQLDGYDDHQMMDIARRCEKISEDIGALYTHVSSFTLPINQAHEDALATISALVDHLHQVHRYQARREHKPSSRYDGWITEGYQNELGASVIEHWHVEVEVQDEMLGSNPNKKGSTYKRKNPRAFTTQLEHISQPRLRLYSSVAVSSTLSTLATNASLLLDQVRVISAELQNVHQRNSKCRGLLNDRPSGNTGLEDIFRAATHKAATAHQAIARVDALRVSLRGFWGARTYSKKKRYDYPDQFDPKLGHLSLLRNETILAGDRWQATWTWLGLQTESPASHVSLGSFLSQWLPVRHFVRLPELREQHAALIELLMDEDTGESMLDGYPRMFYLN